MWRRLRYLFDTSVARRPRILLGWHLGLSAALLFVLAFIAWAFELLDTGDHGFTWTLLFNAVIALDPGTAANVGTGDVGQLAAALFVAIVGILLIGSLIAILHNAIEDRLKYLRKGTSAVVEEGHVVILGWSHRVLAIIENLVDVRCTGTIAVLAERDQVAMEDELKARFRSKKMPRVVFRTGDPVDPNAIDVVHPERARAIIILSPDVDHPDAHVLKILLALETAFVRRDDAGERKLPTIVAQIALARNLDVATSASPRAKFVLAAHVIARMLAQACTRPGLTSVFNELLTDVGNEIYFTPVGHLAGEKFGVARRGFPTASLIGIRRQSGALELNPRDDVRAGAGDAFVAIAPDERSIVAAAGPAEREAPTLLPPRDRHVASTRTLILGFSHKVRRIIRELDAYVAPGSQVMIVGSCSAFDVEKSRLLLRLKNITVQSQAGDPTDRHLLDRLDPCSYDHVIVVASCDDYEVQYADARTIMTLLHLRDMANDDNRKFTVLSELLDSRNGELAHMANAEDIIVDDAFVSRLTAQYAIHPDVEPVYLDLLTDDGNEFYIRSGAEYVEDGREARFDSIIEAARSRNEIALGYRRRQEVKHGPRWKTVLNPAKSDTLTADDELIVLAED